MHVYLETGSKRTFAVALDWPGWARSGRDAEAALAALFAAGPRYAAALRGTRLGFRAPSTLEELEVAARARGNATTDFGAPDVAPSTDDAPIGEAELGRLQTILRAAWRTFDAAVAGAEGAELATGPRGGGRALDRIVDHVLGADESYVRSLGARIADGEPGERSRRVREGAREALDRAVRDGVEPVGPRGGKRWLPRTFVRRSVWHVLDHAWEIEDRTPA